MNPQQFVDKWRHATAKERSSYQEHFIDLCHLLGHPTPMEADPTGQTFAFEAGAMKQDGKQGWADVFKPGCFAFEYKGQDGDLKKAHDQLLQYREYLQNPPLLIVCDLARIIIRTNITNSARKEYTLELDDLLQPAKLDILRRAFFDPLSLRAPQTTEDVTAAAAGDFAKLADNLRRWKIEPQRAAHFLIRILFCLFAEDIGLLPNKLFSRMVEAGRLNPKKFAGQLRQLFAVMATGGTFGVENIFHFDGGLFDTDAIVDLDSDALTVLARSAKNDWSNIEPSIFGTLFERSLDPSKRSQLGAHYTGRDDIERVVKPVLMTPLRRRWAEVKAQALALAAKRDALKARTQRDKLTKQIGTLLTGFAGELAKVKVLDAACGCGNFLYVSLRLLLDLEKEVITLAGDLGLTRPMPQVTPAKLYGIELNEYACELAQITVWIGYIQWLRDNGFGSPDEPILKPLKNIEQKDAIMTLAADGRASEPAWPEVSVIVGNPPFLGGNKIRAELGDTYIDALFKLYDGRVPALADLVCYWFEKAQAMVKAGKVKRVGLLATQGIRGGANRKVLEHIKKSGDIFWAHSDRKWILDGATVHVSMIGFDNGEEKMHELNGQIVSKINPDLTATANLTTAHQLAENSGICFMGPSAKAPFDIDNDLAQQMLNAPLNPHGRPNTDVVRPVVSAIDIGQRSRNKWTIDFALRSKEEAAPYEMPFEYVKKHVYPVRSKNRRAAYAEKWWLYAEARPGMRAALAGKARFIATPGVAKHRLFVWMDLDVLCNQGTLVFARDDDYFFGVLHSRLHELWARGTGTQLREAESGFRYTPTSTFETFPLPWPPGREPQDDPRLKAIAVAAAELVHLRDNWLNPPDCLPAELKKRTLTNLYNARPEWLAQAHAALDTAVFAAYAWTSDLSDDDILARLLALNLERAALGGLAVSIDDNED